MRKLLEDSANVEREIPFLTKDGKKVFEKTVKKITSYFTHPQTKGILKRYMHLQPSQKSHAVLSEFLEQTNQKPYFLKKNMRSFSLPYSVIVVTEQDDIYRMLKEKQILVEKVRPGSSFTFVSDYDIVQAVGIEQTKYDLERHDNVLFYDDEELVFPERNLRLIGSYKESLLEYAKQKNDGCEDEFAQLLELVSLYEQMCACAINQLKADLIVQKINAAVEEKLQNISISASELLFFRGSSQVPPSVQDVITQAIDESDIPPECFEQSLPVTLNKEIFAQYEKQFLTNQFLPLAQEMQSAAKAFCDAEQLLSAIHKQILISDFGYGLNEFIKECELTQSLESEDLSLAKSVNMHIKNAQPIDYELSTTHPAALLTGANSGGKTTLVEHILTLCSLHFIGLPTNGEVSLPRYESIYYFAKNKGSVNKGAFETMLMQLASIKTNGKTLVLADEMESVTEPSVAAKVIAKTMDFFVKKGCHCIFATHLGAILKEHLGENIRIDGIEAKGFDEKGNIIIDHNPVMHKLAASTPELIIQKLANKNDDAFLRELAAAL